MKTISHITKSEMLSCMYFIAASILFFSSTVAHAADFTPLVGIPGITDLKSASLPQYINAVYMVLIAVGGLIAVMRIAWAGVKYSLSDIVTNKDSAKRDIQGVLVGLAILLIPYIVLNTINPDLTSLDVLRSAQPINLSDLEGYTQGTVNRQQTSDLCTHRNQKYDAASNSCVEGLTPAQEAAKAACMASGDSTYNVTKTPPCYKNVGTFTAAQCTGLLDGKLSSGSPQTCTDVPVPDRLTCDKYSGGNGKFVTNGDGTGAGKCLFIALKS